MTTIGKEDSKELLSLGNPSVVSSNNYKSKMISLDCVFLNLCEGWLIFVENQINSIVTITFTDLNNLGSFLQVINHLIEDTCTVLSFSANQLWPVFPDLKGIFESAGWLAQLGEFF